MKHILPAFARATSIIFHPLLIPTLGFFLLFNSGFYFSVLPWELQKYMLLVVFISTCVLPAISIFILSLNPKFNLNMGKNTDRVLSLLISSVFYYLGYHILKRLPIFPMYNVLLIGAVLIQIALLPISMRWNISVHAAAIGGLVGSISGLSFRLHENPILLLSLVIFVAGLVGTSRLILQKHTQSQVYTGFSVGFLILFLIITII